MQQRISMHDTPWALRLLGGALLLGGAAVLTGLPEDVWTRGSRAAILTLMLGGALMVGWKRGLWIDPYAHKLGRWWGVFVPLGERTDCLEPLEAVEIVRKVSRSSQHSQVVYGVRLVDAGRRHRVCSHHDPVRARRRAEALARALDIPLDDRTYAGAVRRRPEELDESLGQRLVREGGVVDPGPPPGRIEIHEQAGKVLLRLPPAGLKASGGLLLLLPVITLPVSLALFALPC
ncbi:MAG: hypothetical protein Q9Q13_10210 [Acidobacteriota bacterium]|nr:hypothetical protein [Acidobacteriota bacterium]